MKKIVLLIFIIQLFVPCTLEASEITQEEIVYVSLSDCQTYAREKCKQCHKQSDICRQLSCSSYAVYVYNETKAKVKEENVTSPSEIYQICVNEAEFAMYSVLKRLK